MISLKKFGRGISPNPTESAKTDILSTTGQIMMNLNDLEFIIRMDQDKSEFFGIDDRTPDHYKPQIKIRVEHVKNTKIDNNER